MAKHEITIRENTGSTKEVAPYLGTYVSKETVKIDPISEAVAKLCGLPAIQVQTILSGAFELIAKMEKEDGAVRVNFDGFAVGQVIRGHFASSDAAFDPAVNALELAILLNEDVRNYLVNVTPTIVADEYATKVRVHNVADTVTPRPYQVIHGKHPFCVTGINLVMSDEGAEVYLEDSKGIKFECVVDEVKSRQEFVAHSAALLAGGDYRLWVKSRGGDAEGTLQSDFRKVKYLHIEDPITVDDIASEGHEGEIVSGTAFAAKGSGLDAFDAEAGDTVKVKWTQGGEDKEATIAPADIAADKLAFEFPDALVGVPVDTELTFEITFGETVKTKGSKLVEE